jgi:hypothetical protein
MQALLFVLLLRGFLCLPMRDGGKPLLFFCSFALMQKNQKIKPGPIAPRGLAGSRLPIYSTDHFFLAAIARDT